MHCDGRMTFRGGAPDDLAFLEKLEELSFAHDRLSGRSWKRFIARGSVMIGLLDCRPAAAAVLLERKNSKTARLYSLAVHPQFRGEGLGRELLAHLVFLCRKKGFAAIRLEAGTDNEVAMRLYREAGFQVVGLLRRYYADGADACRMDLRL